MVRYLFERTDMDIALNIQNETEKIKTTKELAEYISKSVIEEDDISDEKRAKKEAEIFNKLKFGKKLTEKELMFLQKVNPILYAQAMRVQAMAKAVEERLKHARSKEEANEIVTGAINGIPKDDPAKEFMVAAIDRLSRELHESTEYNRLPNTVDSKNEELPISPNGIIDPDATSCYNKNILHPERRNELLDRMLHSMNYVETSGKICEYDESIGREIYSFRVQDGKVVVSGNEGFEGKARAYETLVNASLNKSWNYLFKGILVGETELMEKIDGILKYYMNIDNDYKKNNKKDSITNHVYDAFQKWCNEHEQKETHFNELT